MTEEPWYGLEAGARAPAFTLPSLAGGHGSLSDYRGRRVLLVFVQPHCPGSRALLPVIAGLLPDPEGDQPVPIVVTFGPQPENRRLIDTFGLRCAVLSEDHPDVILRYLIEGTPTAYLIGKRGLVAATQCQGVTASVKSAGLLPGPGVAPRVTPYRAAKDWLRALTVDERARGAGEEVAGSVLPDRLSGANEDELPLVSAIMTTRERPAFLRLALECYRRQTYPKRELIVVDDGSRFPADEAAVDAAGGRLIRMPDKTPLGDKLNRGIREAGGQLLHKWDDDDWYASEFLTAMVSAHLDHVARTGRSPIVYQVGSYWFDLSGWRILDWSNPDPSGGTLFFAREEWERWPFREDGSDMWFVADQLAAGVATLPVRAPALYVYVRHDSLAGGPGHLWTHWENGRATLEHLRDISVPRADPSSFLPDWAVAAYRELSSRPSVSPGGAGLSGDR
jgi:peroxiredoxin